MRVGVGCSGTVVSCLGGDGDGTPPIVPGSEELDSIELAGVPHSGLRRSGHKRAKSSSVIYASFMCHPLPDVPVITCIYNLNSYLISLIFMLILCNYDACYLNFMNFLHWNDILLKFIFMHNLGLIMSFLDD